MNALLTVNDLEIDWVNGKLSTTNALFTVNALEIDWIQVKSATGSGAAARDGASPAPSKIIPAASVIMPQHLTFRCIVGIVKFPCSPS